MSELNMRPAVRGLLIDPEDRVLLVRVEFSDWTGWILPGGGRDDGEDDPTALARELAEETGIPNVFVGPPIWIRRFYFDKPGGSTNRRWDGQEETVYLVPCHRFEIEPTMSTDELRIEGLVEHRWWTADELDATDQIVLPTALPTVFREVLEFGAPAEPHRFEG